MIARKLRRLGAAASLLILSAGAAAPQPELDALLDAPDLVSGEVILLGLDNARRMTVPVSIAGSSRYPFVVDTGAERTIVSHELARALRLEAGPPVSILSMSGREAAGTVLVPQLLLSESRQGSFHAPALSGRHIGAAGIIGLDSLQDKRVLLDFAAGTMTVEPSSEREERWNPNTIVVRAQSRYGQLILADARFMGERIQVIVDTGAQTSVGNLALRDRLARRGTPDAVSLLSVTGGVIMADQRVVDRIEIGGIRLENLSVAFADAPPFARLGLAEHPAMLLGIDALRLFERVSIDFPKRRIRFLPAAGEARGHRRCGFGPCWPRGACSA